MMKLRILGAIGGSVLLLAGCQTDGSGRPAVSLEQAKQVVATFEGTDVAPPPRSIEDITAILDQEEIADRSEWEAKLRLADSPLPEGGDPVELMALHVERAQAAHDVGRPTQGLDEYRKAAELQEKAKLPGGNLTGRVYSGRGVTARFFGNFQEAIAAFEAGISIGLSSPYRHLVAAHLYMGDFENAERIAQRAISLARERLARGQRPEISKLSNRLNIAMINGLLHSASGRWKEAEAPFREGMTLIAEVEALTGRRISGTRNSVEGGLRKSLVAQGRLLEAEVFARDMLKEAIRWRGKASHTTAGNVGKLAGVINAQGRYEEAKRLNGAALKIFRDLGMPARNIGFGRSRYAYGETLVSLEEWDAAVSEFDALQRDFKDIRQFTFDQWVQTGVDAPLAYLKAGRTDDAHAMISAGFESVSSRLGEEHPQTALKQGVLAMTLAVRGDSATALRHFRAAVPILLDQGDQKPSTEKRLKLILAAYIDLLIDVRGTSIERDAGLDAAAEAFRIAEVSRSRSVQNAMAASGARAAAGNADLADLIRRQQDSGKQQQALQVALVDATSLPTAEQDAAAIAALQDKVSALGAARSAIAAEIDRSFPEYADLVRPKPATIERVQGALQLGEALISVYVGESRTLVWAIPKQGQYAFAVTDMGRWDIGKTVARLRRALDPRAATLGDIPDFDVARAHELYENLLAPVQDGWKSADTLLVVPDGALGQLPFTVLVTEPVKLANAGGALFSNFKDIPWLARDHAIAVLPGVSALVSLRALPAADPDRLAFIGFGDPYFSAAQAKEAQSAPVQTATLTTRGALTVRSVPVQLRSAPDTRGVQSADISRLPRLPDTKDEIISMAEATAAVLERDVHLGTEANEQVVRSAALDRYKVVAFATHGLIPGDLDGLIQPALALSSPDVTNSDDDGLLTMSEVLGLKLDSDWVVLSACNTAAADGKGAEAFSGLGRAFFYAGTRAVMLTNWPVETTSARLLTTDIFRRQAGDSTLSRGRAMQAAMLKLIDGPGYVDEASGKAVFSYAHPIFWAPFSLVGDGGGAAPAS